MESGLWGAARKRGPLFASGHFISAQEARPSRRGRQNVILLMPPNGLPSRGLKKTGALWRSP
jgi:hypothetical protein